MTQKKQTSNPIKNPARHSRAGGNPNNKDENLKKENINSLITHNLDIWTSAIQSKSRTGRGNNKTYELYGIKELRALILDLAVRGLLVPQDPNDEPASELLKRIAAEKEQLIKEGKIKKQKELPGISDDEKPFVLPDGWGLVTFSEVGELARGKSKHRPRNDHKLFHNETIKFLQTGDVARSKQVIETYNGSYNEAGLHQSRLWHKGTLCITIAANIADTGILGFDACFPDSVVDFMLIHRQIPVEYFDYLIITTKRNLEKFAPSTAQRNVNLGILETLLIPLPPVSKQKRIVEKVSKILNLCETITLNLKNQQIVKNRLTDTLIVSFK